MDEVLFGEITRKFSDCKFSLGKSSEGWDCLSYIHNIYISLGVNFPKEFKGFNAENYADKWNKGEGKKEFEEFLLSLGNPIEINYARKGDLFVLKGAEMIFPAVNLGNGHILLMFDIGGRIVPYKFFAKMIIGTRRLID